MPSGLQEAQAITDATRKQLEHAIEQHYPAVRGSMALLVSESGVAEDLTQEVFARLCAFLERQPEVNNAWGLLRGFMRNVWLEHLRRRRRSGVGEPDSERTPDPALLGPADTAERREDLARLQRALATLTEEERAVVLGKYYLDMTGEQLTEWLGVPRRTLLDRLHRAVGKLRKEFGVSDTWK